MKKYMKKISIMLCSALIAISAIGAMPTSASCTDTSWSRNNSYTRLKENDSSIYIKNSSGSSGKLSVYGTQSLNGTSCSVSSYNGNYLTTTGLTFPAYSERLVRQYVYERNYRYARVVFSGNATNGKWSPDSVGTYRYIN